MSKIDISVIIITRGRAEMLSACLTSVLRGGRQPFEILVGINGTDACSAAVLEKFKPSVQPVLLPGQCRGEARNSLAARARGRWLCFLDDDVVVPENYFSALYELILQHSGAVVFGGGQTLSAEAGSFEAAVYALLGSPWGGGPFVERFSPVEGTRAAGPEKFILCNLTLDSAFLRQQGLGFEGHLSSAEENLLLNRMAAAGALMILSGGLNLIHRRRKSPAHFARQVFSSGRGRAQITLLSPRGFAPFTLLPPLALAAALAAAFILPVFFLIMAAIYGVVSLFCTLRLDATGSLKSKVLFLFPLLHVAYAAGWFCGLLEGIVGGFVRPARPWRCVCHEKR